MKALTIAFSSAAIAGLMLSACYVPQPSFECFPAPHFWGNMVVQSVSDPDDIGCGTYTGDAFDIQRYLPPRTSTASIAVMSDRFGQYSRDLYGEHPDPSDPDGKKEVALGDLVSADPDENGICMPTSTGLSVADQNFPSFTTEEELADGGVEITTTPALRLTYKYEDFKFINTARFPGTIFQTKLTITENTCTATYLVDGVVQTVFGPVSCETDADCSPFPDPEAGRIAGSGLSEDIKPVCGPDGICIGSVPFDELVKLK